MDDKRKLLYDQLSNDYDLGDFESFSSKLDDEEKRKAFYDVVSKDYDLGDYDSFVGKIEPQLNGERVDNTISGGTGTQEEADAIFEANYNRVRQQRPNVPNLPTLQEQAYPDVSKGGKLSFGKPGFGKDEASALYPMSSSSLKERLSDPRIFNKDMSLRAVDEAREEEEIDKFFVSKPMNTAKDVMDNFGARFTNTQRGIELGEELAKTTKDIQDKYVNEYLASDEYKALASMYKGEELAKKANEQFGLLYGDAINKEVLPYQQAYNDELQRRYGKQMDKELNRINKEEAGNHARELMTTVDSELEDVEKRITERAKVIRNENWKPGMPSSRDDKRLAELRGERAYLEGAKELIDDSQKILNAVEAEKDGNFFGGLGRGIRDSAFDIDTWTMGLSDLVGGLRLRNALEKAEKGEELTSAEQRLLDASVNNMAVNYYYRNDLGRGYQAGEITGQSIPFMLEFIVNPVSASGNAIAKSLLNYGMKRFAVGALGKNATKIGTRLVADAIAAGGVTATSGIGNVMSGTIDRLNRNYEYGLDEEGNLKVTNTNKVSLGEALGKSAATAFLERQSEMIFNAFKGAPSLFKGVEMSLPGGVNTFMNYISNSRVGELWRGIKNNATMRELAQRAQFHGLGEEYLEEVYNNFANIPLGEMTFDEATDLEQNLVTFLGLAPTQVMFGAIGGIGYGVERYKARRDMERTFGRMTDEQKRKLMELQEMGKLSTNRDIAIFLAETIKDESLTPEQKRDKIEYAYNLAKQNAIDEVGNVDVEDTIEADNAQIDDVTNLSTGEYIEVDRWVVDGETGVRMPQSGYIVGWIGESPVFLPEGMENTKENRIVLKPNEWNPESVQRMPAEDVKALNEEMIREEAAAQAERESKYAPEVLNMQMQQGVPFNTPTSQIVPVQPMLEGNGWVVEEYPIDTNNKVAKQPIIRELTNDEFRDLMQAQLEANEAQQAQAEEAAANTQAVVENMPRKTDETGRIFVPTSVQGDEVAYDITDAQGNILEQGTSKVSQFAKMQDYVAPVEERLNDNGTSGESVGEQVNGEVKNPEELQPVAEGVASAAERAERVEEKPVIPTKEDGSVDFVAYGKEGSFKMLGERYGEKMPNKVAVTAKALADDLNEAQQKLDKAEEAYDNAPIGREAKAEAARDKARQELEAVKREADFWAEMDAEIKAAQQRREEILNPTVGVESSNEPLTADEFVVQQLSAGNLVLNKDDYMRETGYGSEEANAMNGGGQKLFAKDGMTIQEAGERLMEMTIQEAGERLMEMDRENGTNFFDQNDPNAGRDALISLLGSVKSRKELNQYIAENRKAQAKRDAEGLRNEAERAVMDAHFASLEDFVLQMEADEVENPFEGIDMAGKDAIFTEAALEYESYLKSLENGQGTTEAVVEGNGDVLSEEQSDDTGGIEERQGQVDGTGEGTLQEDEGAHAGEQGSEAELKQQEGETILQFAERVAEEQRRRPLRKRVKEWENLLGVKVNVIERPEDVKNKEALRYIAKGKTPSGWVESNGEVAIYLHGTPDVAEVDKTMIHEVVAHRGLPGLLGRERFDELCDKVWDMMPDAKRTEYLDYVGDRFSSKQERQRAAADEYMAFLAEGVDLTPQDKSVWKEIVKYIRSVIESVMGKSSITDKDIEELLRASFARFVAYKQAVDARGGRTMFRISDKGRKIQDNVDKFAEKYNSKETVVEDVSSMSDEEIVETLGLPADKVRKAIGEGLIGGYDDNKDKIIIFADNQSLNDLEDTMFHENLHVLLADNRDVVESFYANAAPRFPKNIEYLKGEGYKDKDIPEELFVRLAAKAMDYGIFDDVIYNLPEEMFDRFKEIINKFGYGYRQEIKSRILGKGRRGTSHLLEGEEIHETARLGLDKRKRQPGTGSGSERAERLQQLFGQVADMGLEGVLGNRAYSKLMVDIFKELPEGVRVDLADDALRHYGGSIAPAVSDYVNKKGKASLWDKVAGFIREALRKVGIELDINANDAKYILWRSQKPLNRVSLLDVAEDIDMRYRMKVGEFEDSPTRFRAIDEVNERFNEGLSALNEENADKVELNLGRPSAILRAAGVEDKPMKLYGNKVIKKMKKHGFNLDELRDLPNAVADPIAVFKNYGEVGNRSILTELKTEQGNFLVTLSLGKGHDIDFNIVTSVFGKGESNIVDWIEKGYGVYYNKKKTLNYLHHSALKAATSDNREFQNPDYLYLSAPIAEASDKSEFDSATKIVESFENPKVGEGNVRKNDGGTRFRVDVGNKLNIRDQYEATIKKGGYQAREAVQDSMLSLRRMQELIEKAEGKELRDFENAWMHENRLSSVVQSAIHEMERKFYKPMTEAVKKLMKAANLEQEQVADYLMLKHGIERNREMAVRKALTDSEGKIDRDKLNDWYEEKRRIRNDASLDTWRKKQEAMDDAALMFGADMSRDYSGLTSMFDTDDLADCTERAYNEVEALENAHPSETEALGKAIKAMTQNTLNESFGSGLMDRKVYDELSNDMYDHYIPLRGFEETTSDEVYAYMDNDRGAFNAPLVRAKGRSSKADNPLAYLKSIAESGIMQGERNKMKQTFLNMVVNHPSDLVSVREGVWAVFNPATGEWEAASFPESRVPRNATPSDVEAAYEQWEADMEQQAATDPNVKKISEAADVPYRVIGNRMNQHQVIVKRLGKSYTLTINGNPRLAMALNGLTNPNNTSNDGKVSAYVQNKIDMVNRNLSAWYTTRNPDFVASNFMRDTFYTNTIVRAKEGNTYANRFNAQYAKLLMPGRMIDLFRKYENGTLDLSKPMERDFHEFMLNGGETGYSNLKDLEHIKKQIAKDVKGGRWENVEKAVEILDIVNRAVENTARFAAYRTSRQQGRSVVRSIFDAKEISVNFNKKGSGGTFFGATGQTGFGNLAAMVGAGGRAMYVFFNAAIQGTTNLLHVTKKNPVGAGAGLGAMFLMGAVIPMLLGGDDEKDYYDLPEHVRRNHLILPGGGDSWVSIPLPIEYRIMYGMGELLTSWRTGHERGSDIGRKMLSLTGQALPLNFLEEGVDAFVPSAISPLWQVYNNRSWTGLPIYKDNEFNKDNPEYTKAYKNVDRGLYKFTKALYGWTFDEENQEEGIDLNPAVIEHIARGYFGGLVTTLGNVVKTAETIAGEREFDWRSIPIGNRIFKSGDERTKEKRIQNEYFENVDKLDFMQSRERLLRKTKDGTGVPEADRREADEDYKVMVGSKVYKKYIKDPNSFKNKKKAADRIYRQRKEKDSEELERKYFKALEEANKAVR